MALKGLEKHYFLINYGYQRIARIIDSQIAHYSNASIERYIIFMVILLLNVIKLYGYYFTVQ